MKTISKAVIRRIESTNKLIKQTNDSHIFAVETDSTWESLYQFEEIKFNDRFVYVEYTTYHNKEITKTRYNVNNPDHLIDLNAVLKWVKRCCKKGIRLDQSEGN